MNNGNFTVLVSGGSRSCRVTVYCVTVAFKVTAQVEQRNCIKFCIKLESIQMTQKAAAMGNW